MAVQCADRLRRLVLVSPAGIKPEQAEALDVFVTPWKRVIAEGFFRGEDADGYRRIYEAAPLIEFGGTREAGRTMSMRMCFRPYMYDPALPAMLGKIEVPTLIAWGAQDRIMPVECGHAFASAIPRATLRVLDKCGHLAHLDQPELLASTIREFVR
jgi:pimeloyl-ACP methyl ester carboxylesterase